MKKQPLQIRVRRICDDVEVIVIRLLVTASTVYAAWQVLVAHIR